LMLCSQCPHWADFDEKGGLALRSQH